MGATFFSIDFRAAGFLLLFAGLCFVLFRWSRLFQDPHIKFSGLSLFNLQRTGYRSRYFNLSQYLLYGALCLFALAFLDPHYFVLKARKDQPPINEASVPTEGIAIYLVLDQSGSMSQEVKAYSSQGGSVVLTKMDLLKQVTKDFVAGNTDVGLRGRPNDLIGLIAFARGAQVLSPLTLDHKMILDQLKKLQFNTSMDQDGTSIGYAIFKAANLIAATRHYAEDLAGEGEPAYSIKSTIMILITDGFQSPSPLDKGKRLRNMDMLEAGLYARENGIKLYIVNVDPKIASDEFSAYRTIMKNVSEITGGQFFLVDSSRGLDRIYADIDQMEKSVLPLDVESLAAKGKLPNLYNRISFYPYLIVMGMISLLAAVLLDCVVMRRVP